jgi:Ni/Co efflux regulator RcnB
MADPHFNGDRDRNEHRDWQQDGRSGDERGHRDGERRNFDEGGHGDRRDDRHDFDHGDRRDDGRDFNRWDRGDHERFEHSRDFERYRRFEPRYYQPYGFHSFRRGERLPVSYYARPYVIDDYRACGLYAPPRGYYWARVNGDAVLAAIATGIVLDAVYHVF